MATAAAAMQYLGNTDDVISAHDYLAEVSESSRAVTYNYDGESCEATVYTFSDGELSLATTTDYKGNVGYHHGAHASRIPTRSCPQCAATAVRIARDASAALAEVGLLTQQDLDDIAVYLDDARREDIVGDVAPCTPAEYVAAYAARYGTDEIVECAERVHSRVASIVRATLGLAE